MRQRDVFLCHASEDKADVARPLAEALRRRGITVWLDEQELHIGDGLLQKIDEGLRTSDFGAVILSPSFFGKSWPRRELDGLTTRELTGGTVIVLPIWHNVDAIDVSQYSPSLADKLAATTGDGLESVADQIAKRVQLSRSRAAMVRDAAAPPTGEVLPFLGDPSTWVTLIEEASFCISSPSGDIRGGTPDGLFFRDTRFLSEWDTRVNGEPLTPFSHAVGAMFAAEFLGGVVPMPGQRDSTVTIRRSRNLGGGLREELSLFNFGEEPAVCTVDIAAAADYADLVQVKEGRLRLTSDITVESTSTDLILSSRRRGSSRATRITARDATSIAGDAVRFEVTLGPQESWSTCIQVAPIID